MSATELQRLVEDARADEALRAGLAARNIDEFVAAGRGLGYDIDAADVQAAGFPSGELSEGELDAVSAAGDDGVWTRLNTVFTPFTVPRRPFEL